MALIAMWAVVLIPMWWRRQQSVHPTLSIDRFNGLMKSLAGEAGQVEPSLGTLTPVERRRRVFGALLGMLLVSTIAVVLGAPLWLVILPISLMGAFVYAARGQVERERQTRQRMKIRALAMAQHPAGSARIAREAKAAPARATTEVTVIPSVGPLPARIEENAVRGVRYDEGNASLGSLTATPATLPSYVSAPAATRVPRVIDLKTPGAWSAQAMLEEAEAQRQPAPAPVEQTFADLYVEDTPVVVAPEVDEDLEQILRRVVNE